MKYYLHDTNAFQDDKITELYINFGYEGLGLFYTILEKIAMQEKPIKTSVLKAQLNVGKKLEKCWKFMESLELISSNNGETFNERILSYNETYQIKKEKNKIKLAEWRKNQANKNNVTSYEPSSNPPKGKVTKEKVTNINKREGERKGGDQQPTPILFIESEIFDKKIFSEKLAGTQYEGADIDWYHERLKNWSDSKNDMKLNNWLATVKKWMMEDMRDGKFISKNYNGKNGKQSTAATSGNVIPIRSTAGKL